MGAALSHVQVRHYANVHGYERAGNTDKVPAEADLAMPAVPSKSVMQMRERPAHVRELASAVVQK